MMNMMEAKTTTFPIINNKFWFWNQNRILWCWDPQFLESKTRNGYSRIFILPSQSSLISNSFQYISYNDDDIHDIGLPKCHIFDKSVCECVFSTLNKFPCHIRPAINCARCNAFPIYCIWRFTWFVLHYLYHIHCILLLSLCIGLVHFISLHQIMSRVKQE